MQKTLQISHKRADAYTSNAPKSGRLSVRTNLRAGSALEDIGDKAKDLWNSLTGAVSNAVSSVTSNPTDTTAS